MITSNAKNDLYELLKNNGGSSVSSSNILPNPSYKSKINTEFKTKINTKLSTANAFEDSTIKGIETYKDIKVVWGLWTRLSDGAKYGFISCFDLENNLIDVFWETTENYPTGPKSVFMNQFIDVKIDKNGIIYGVLWDEIRINVFRLSDILSQVGILDKADIDVFYSGLVDITTETPKDPAKPTENIMGYNQLKLDEHSLFSIISSFNEDNTYMLSYWSGSADSNIRIMKITVPLGARTQRECDWLINEDIKLVKAQPATNFNDISGIGIAAGTKTVSTGATTSEDIVGSLLIETSKETTGNTFVNQTKSIPSDITSIRWKLKDFWHNYNLPNPGSTRSFVKEFDLGKVITDYNTFINGLPSSTRNISSTTKIAINTYSGTRSITVPLDNNQMKQIIDNNNLKFKYTITVKILAPRPVTTVVSEKIEIISTGSAGNVHEVVTNSPVLLAYNMQDISNIGSWFMAWDISSNTNVSYELQQTTSSKATTQMISLVSNSSDIEYRVSQVENNIYKGSKPVFINLTKAYVPLLSRTMGNSKFDIYEFDSAFTTTTEINKFFNTHTPESQADNSDFIIELSNVGTSGIVELRIDGVTNTDFTLVRNTLTIHNISKNKAINITYKSTVGTPKKITINTSTNSEDMFITGIDNTDELTTLDKTIVGVGDDGTNDFGMILYKSKPNIDDDSIAEDVQALRTQLKHIAGARQNNLVYIYGYNSDFTQEVRWISIYPESFKPYTYNPYDDKKKEFAVERLNGSSSNVLKDTNFDREFLNVSLAGNTIIASTEAKQSDANFKGDEVVSVYGHTNKKLFEKTITDYEKTRQESRELNFSINTKVIDNVNGGITRQKASDTLGQVFNLKNAGAADNIGIKLRVVYIDGNYSDEDITAISTIENGIIKVSKTIAMVITPIEKLQLLNKKDELLSESLPCDGHKPMLIKWDIRIDGTAGPPPVVNDVPKWETAKWGELKWQ